MTDAPVRDTHQHIRTALHSLRNSLEDLLRQRLLTGEEYRPTPTERRLLEVCNNLDTIVSQPSQERATQEGTRG